MKKTKFYLWSFKNRDDRVYDFSYEEMNFEKSPRLDKEDVESVKPLYVKEAELEGEVE